MMADEERLIADAVRQELAELADIVRVIAAESRCGYMVMARIDRLIDNLIGAGLGPRNDGGGADG